MITVLMSVGISVDYVAHVSYYYVQAMKLDVPLSKAQRALRFFRPAVITSTVIITGPVCCRHLGLPIIQGALSTMCGMMVLLAINAYMVRAFVKTLFLVVAFGSTIWILIRI